MTVLDVFLNDRKLCRAGVGADGVLSAIVSWVKLKGQAATTARRLRKPLEETRLHVGGLRDDTHRTWSQRKLAVGDRVSIVATRATAFDPPKGETRRDPQQAQRQERDYYLRLKRKFEGPRREPPALAVEGHTPTSFLNVDLDIWSKAPLDPLVSAFGRQVLVLHAGKEGPNRYAAHLELSGGAHTADRLIRRFVRQVERLPRAARRIWDRALAREFNLGIQAAGKPYRFELRLAQQTVLAVASVNARIGVTVYGAESEQRPEVRG